MTGLDVDALESAHVAERWGDECAGCRADCEYCEGTHPWPCDVVVLLGEVRKLTVGQGSDDGDIAVEDVRAIAVALGLGGHARPYSAHDVVQREILPAIRAAEEG